MPCFLSCRGLHAPCPNTEGRASPAPGRARAGASFQRSSASLQPLLGHVPDRPNPRVLNDVVHAAARLSVVYQGAEALLRKTAAALRKPFRSRAFPISCTRNEQEAGHESVAFTSNIYTGERTTHALHAEERCSSGSFPTSLNAGPFGRSLEMELMPSSQQQHLKTNQAQWRPPSQPSVSALGFSFASFPDLVMFSHLRGSGY